MRALVYAISLLMLSSTGCRTRGFVKEGDSLGQRKPIIRNWGTPLSKRLKLPPQLAITHLCYLLAAKPGGLSHPVIGAGSLAAGG